jgi:6-pyruvoyltetrahydropterin/6-carboxytetrahydropterin synthase
MNGSLKIAREFHWEMGHRLPFHTSGCANIHGHSYKLWVEIEGVCDDSGMLMDYGDMKNVVMPVIEEFDHCFLCDAYDELLLPFLESAGLKFKVVPFSTTAEHLVQHLLDRLWDVFAPFGRISGLRLRLQETDISYAEAGRARATG